MRVLPKVLLLRSFALVNQRSLDGWQGEDRLNKESFPNGVKSQRNMLNFIKILGGI